MATASHIELTPSTTGVLHAPTTPTQPSSTAASSLLQQNHEKFHMFFNNDGFHNHIAHHLLTIFALGATPTNLQAAFNSEKVYQRPQFPVNEENVKAMREGEWKKFLGKEKYFHDWEAFFKGEIESHEQGWKGVLKDFLFGGSQRADDMLVRMYSGFLHPIIHLGFGVEFKQPAIIVEALAQAAIHDDWIRKFLLDAEKAAAAAASTPSSSSSPQPSLHDLLDEIRASEILRTAAHLDDGNKIRDGVIARAGAEMIAIAAKWRVKPEELPLRTAEMINAAAYFAGTAQWPGKAPKVDFFYMHSVNASIFYSAFLNEGWLKDEDKVKLLEWKGRMDLAMYTSRGAPELVLERVSGYEGKKKEKMSWAEVMGRVSAYRDDGHASKLIRALANGERTCREFEGKEGEGWPLKGEMWLKLGNLVMDSVEAGGPRWVRNCGFEEAWRDVPEERARL